MYVIGTAGHVDHGKTSLVKALTGINPDRLKEEIQREMTIELGFAWINLDDLGLVGIIDVPGHRDFIENMVAGVGGIDAVIFVIAADEGIMPQTTEHLAILDILQIKGGVIAITKSDLIKDSDWFNLIEDESRKLASGTVLENAPIVRVSSKTGEGLDLLKSKLREILAKKLVRGDFGRPRLPIDRVFSITGFGTVVTGTLLDGSLSLGDEVELLPGKIRGRVRGLQSYKSKEESISPGARAAVNISGINVDSIKRGDFLVGPGNYTETHLMDVSFKLLSVASSPLQHNTEVKFFLGAAEIFARVRTIGCDEIKPGQKGFLQLELKTPVPAYQGDHFILRIPSPGETIGGGVILDPVPLKRHKRNDKEIIGRLTVLEQGDPEKVIISFCKQRKVVNRNEIGKLSHLDEVQVESTVKGLVSLGQIKVIPLIKGMEGESILMDQVYHDSVFTTCIKSITQYQSLHPLKQGIPREDLKSKLSIETKLFQLLISNWARESKIIEVGPFISTPDHKIVFTPAQNTAIQGLLGRFDQSPYSPPTVKECKEAVGDEIYNLLVESNQLIMISEDVVFKNTHYHKLIEETKKDFLGASFTLAEFRDHFKTSRRYAQAFLEHLDAIHITIREGDSRRLQQDNSLKN